MSEDLPGSGCP